MAPHWAMACTCSSPVPSTVHTRAPDHAAWGLDAQACAGLHGVSAELARTQLVTRPEANTDAQINTHM